MSTGLKQAATWAQLARPLSRKGLRTAFWGLLSGYHPDWRRRSQNNAFFGTCGNIWPNRRQWSSLMSVVLLTGRSVRMLMQARATARHSGATYGPDPWLDVYRRQAGRYGGQGQKVTFRDPKSKQ